MTIKTDLTRRSFIKTAAAGAGAVAVPMAMTGCGADDNDSDNNKKSEALVFAHGVASGDPLADRVIIWTRITPENTSSASDVDVDWAVSTTSDMSNPLKSGTVTTNSAKDFTVKVDVTELLAGTTYYYQFTNANAAPSIVGTTKTLPEGNVTSITLAVCSCANYPAGYFNVYSEIAKSSADIVLHLGDYIYEYAVGEYGTTANTIDQGRNHSPAKEVWTLADYRQRYAQYRQDSMLQAAHKAKPFICVWDDHELANDSYKNGAQNHNEDQGEGAFTDRRSAAFQAYHEWLPIRSGNDLSDIYRQFEIGDLVNLQMMDTRHIARTKPIDLNGDFPEALEGDTAAFIAEIGSTDRTLLGSQQFNAVTSNMTNSSATWQVFGQQVLMGRILVPSELLVALGTLQFVIEEKYSEATITALQNGIKTKLTELATIKAGYTPAMDGPATEDDLKRIASVAPYNLDSWDGYAYERERLLGAAANGNKNLVVLAGDTHNAWASDLRPLNSDGITVSDVRAGVEFATSSVSSPGFDEYLTFDDNNPASAFEGVVTSLVDDLKFMDASRRGFMLVTFTPEKATSEWKFLSTIQSTADVTVDTVTFEVAASGATMADKLVKVS
ncbi:MAG: alkaline phosphatase D family protein [Oleispira antarctica]|nr:alkaline phosphatase D family protein [Oleispira antarctica]MBQ0793367.1 alkaline phosphatase D family protein [Oleispira antarctica]